MVKELPLSKGGVALVDDDVYEWAKRYTWHSGGSNRQQYVQRTTQIGHGARGRRVVSRYLHREIMQPAKGVEVDHINRDPLDNRRQNIRLVTRAQNSENRGASLNSRTGVRGVTQDRRSGRYLAQIFRNRKRICVGSYLTLAEASDAAAAARRAVYSHTVEDGSDGSAMPKPSSPKGSTGFSYVYRGKTPGTYVAHFDTAHGRVWVGTFTSARAAAVAVAQRRRELGLSGVGLSTKKPFDYAQE